MQKFPKSLAYISSFSLSIKIPWADMVVHRGNINWELIIPATWKMEAEQAQSKDSPCKSKILPDQKKKKKKIGL
jgi:hypothetical protein